MRYRSIGLQPALGRGGRVRKIRADQRSKQLDLAAARLSATKIQLADCVCQVSAIVRGEVIGERGTVIPTMARSARPR